MTGDNAADGSSSFLIQGTGGWYLVFSSCLNGEVTYRLHCDKLKVCYKPEEHYLQTDEYFYSMISVRPLIYTYVSKSIGGGILFQGKGRWSGSAHDFGYSLCNKRRQRQVPYLEVVVNSRGCNAMNIYEVKDVLKRHFSGHKFKLKKNKSTGSVNITLPIYLQAH